MFRLTKASNKTSVPTSSNRVLHNKTCSQLSCEGEDQFLALFVPLSTAQIYLKGKLGAKLVSPLIYNFVAVVKSAEGAKLVTKFKMLARTVSAEGPLRDMVKVIWRMVKQMSGNAEHKLKLFFIAVGTGQFCSEIRV